MNLELEDEQIEEELPDESKNEDEDSFEKNMEIMIQNEKPVEVVTNNIMLEKYTKFQRTNSRQMQK